MAGRACGTGGATLEPLGGRHACCRRHAAKSAALTAAISSAETFLKEEVGDSSCVGVKDGLLREAPHPISLARQ